MAAITQDPVRELAQRWSVEGLSPSAIKFSRTEPHDRGHASPHASSSTSGTRVRGPPKGIRGILEVFTPVSWRIAYEPAGAVSGFATCRRQCHCKRHIFAFIGGI